MLQGQEIVENGKIKAKLSVVPRSGTGDLSWLRGEGGFGLDVSLRFFIASDSNMLVNCAAARAAPVQPIPAILEALMAK